MVSHTHIRVLPIQVINKIAAGEVVERPASVVKELIENAVDARATQIDVDIAAGGRKLVAVKDNGEGMNRDDALLSIERHATSKISTVDDIERINTLGFRGEALAAIASVSRFRLTACGRGETTGTEIVISGGKLADVRDIGCPQGVCVEVRDLFFNVPARRKFLRSQQTELSHVRDQFLVHALAHPEIGMSLKVDGRDSYRLAAGAGKQDRLRDLFGPSYQQNLRPVDFHAGEVSISGYVTIPQVSRADRGEQYFFVNGRATSAPLMGYAVREGYRTLLPSDRHPSVFLFLEMDPGLVDVNVHPAKREVRFRHPGEVRDAIIAAIRQALASDAGKALETTAGTGKTQPAGIPPAADVQLKIDDMPPTRAFRYPRMAAVSTARGAEAKAAPGVPAQAEGAQQPAGGPRKEQKPSSASPWSWCRVVGQIGGLYVVLETEDGYVLMDPHAAHERVLFERFMSDFENGMIQTQSLLMPETVELRPKDAVRVRENLGLFRKMGFGISEFGGDTFVVDAIPSCLGEIRAESLLIEMAHDMEEAGGRGARGRWREEAIAQAACKSAVKARDRLTLGEIEELVVALARTEMPYTCPHGRPTLIFTSFKDLNRKFGRE